MPVIVLCSLIAIAVIAIGLYAWGEFRRGTPSFPDREVHAGMYDFKKAAQDGTLGRRQDAQ
jgi:hypothetical protein